MSFLGKVYVRYKVHSAGYHEYSKSNNALDAEAQERFP